MRLVSLIIDWLCCMQGQDNRLRLRRQPLVASFHSCCLQWLLFPLRGRRRWGVERIFSFIPSWRTRWRDGAEGEVVRCLFPHILGLFASQAKTSARCLGRKSLSQVKASPLGSLARPPHKVFGLSGWVWVLKMTFLIPWTIPRSKDPSWGQPVLMTGHSDLQKCG